MYKKGEIKMDNIARLKLGNEISMKVIKNEFPINGKTTITITMKNNKPETVEVKNTNAKK
jgi:hypothetical protein